MRRLKRILGVLMCRIGIPHSWKYDRETVVQCNRQCRRCGRWEHSTYDGCYGDTIWLPGKKW